MRQSLTPRPRAKQSAVGGIIKGGIALLLVLCVTVVSCSSTSKSECAKDTDCSGNFVCTAGHCVSEDDASSAGGSSSSTLGSAGAYNDAGSAGTLSVGGDGGLPNGCSKLQIVACKETWLPPKTYSVLLAPGYSCHYTTCPDGQCCGDPTLSLCVPQQGGGDACYAPGAHECENAMYPGRRCGAGDQCEADGCCPTGATCVECDKLGKPLDPCQCVPATEVCNGKDDDCDGIVDNEPFTDERCAEQVGTGGVCHPAVVNVPMAVPAVSVSLTTPRALTATISRQTGSIAGCATWHARQTSSASAEPAPARAEACSATTPVEPRMMSTTAVAAESSVPTAPPANRRSAHAPEATRCAAAGASTRG